MKLKLWISGCFGPLFRVNPSVLSRYVGPPLVLINQCVAVLEGTILNMDGRWEIESCLTWFLFLSCVCFILQDAPSELYGPLMLTLSLVAVLLYGMKSFGHQVVSFVFWAIVPIYYTCVGRGHSNRHCHGCLFCILVGCIQLAVLHLVFTRCSIVNGTSTLYNSEWK